MFPLAIPFRFYALAAALAAAGLYHWHAVASAYSRGKADTLAAARVEAGHRILTMEQTVENFRHLPARDRCLAFMRDSGLPERHCDER